MLTESSPRVSVALEITEDLPEPAAISRWLAEPVKVSIIIAFLNRRLLVLV